VTRYDIILANPPEGPTGPVVCTECRTRVLYDCEDFIGTVHCTDEARELVGTFVVDDAWDWAEHDPRIP
jgi:hypothetical protein